MCYPVIPAKAGICRHDSTFKLQASLGGIDNDFIFPPDSLALKVEQNELLKQAFVISSTDAHPGALEKIAMSLGER